MTQTKQHHSDLLQLQTNAEETNSNKESSPLIEREQIPNSPFWNEECEGCGRNYEVNIPDLLNKVHWAYKWPDDKQGKTL